MAGIRSSITRYIKSGHTLLCGGPMSLNTIRALLESAVEFKSPLVLTASRRQVDSVKCAGGYVFATEDFARCVRSLSKKMGITDGVYMERDHGGPGQGEYKIEKNLSFKASMNLAKISFEEDIKNGFEIIHIDPTLIQFPAKSNHNVDKILEMIFELYEYCWDVSLKYKKVVEFEIGAEAQIKGVGSVEEFGYVVSRVMDFCKNFKIKKPLFFVGQTGSCVLEDRNIGVSSALDKNLFVSWFDKVKRMVRICADHGCFLKEHNGDYLDMETLLLRPAVGVGGVNVAPEFAVAETGALFYLLKIFGMRYELDRFIDIAVKSEKWRRWVSSEKISDERKALLCGHYVYKNPEVSQIIKKAKQVASKRGIYLEEYLVQNIKARIFRYLAAFNG